MLFNISLCSCESGGSSGQKDFLVKHKKGVSYVVLERIISKHGLKISGKIEELGILKVSGSGFSGGSDVKKLIKTLETYKEIIYVEIDQSVKALKE